MISYADFSCTLLLAILHGVFQALDLIFEVSYRFMCLEINSLIVYLFIGYHSWRPDLLIVTLRNVME